MGQHISNDDVSALDFVSEEYLRKLQLDRLQKIVKHTYDNVELFRTRMQEQTVDGGGEDLSPMELLERFYEQRNGQPMSNEQRQLSEALMEQIWEEQL